MKKTAPRQRRRRPCDPLLRTQPWKVLSVFDPIERILHRLETDGTVEAVGQQVVFKDAAHQGYYDVPAALHGIADFHRIASLRYGCEATFAALERLANKLHHGSPVFECDLKAARADIASCKKQALRLRVSQAESILNSVRISAEFDRGGMR